MHQITKDISKLCGKLKMERPRKANTHVSAEKSEEKDSPLETKEIKHFNWMDTWHWNLRTTHEGHSTQCLLHQNLGDRRQVVVGVVGHHDSRKQNRHDSCEWSQNNSNTISWNHTWQKVLSVWTHRITWCLRPGRTEGTQILSSCQTPMKESFSGQSVWGTGGLVRGFKHKCAASCYERSWVQVSLEDTSDEMSPVRVPRAAEPKNMLRK